MMRCHRRRELIHVNNATVFGAVLQTTMGNTKAVEAWQANTEFPMDKAYLDQQGVEDSLR